MEIIDRLYATNGVVRMRAQVDRLRLSILTQRPAVRWGLAVAAVLGLAAGVYWGAMSLSPVGVRYLASGRRFSSEDLNKIRRVLDAQRIEYHTDGEQKITVDADQFDQAATLVAKLAVGPRPIDEARDQVNSLSVWFESPRDREKKEQIAREKMIELMIGKLEGIAFSFVSINRPRSAAWNRTAPKPSAFVYIETEGDRQLPFQSIQSIAGFLEGFEHDLTMGSIKIMDRRGHKYLDPDNPSLTDLSRNRAREEELSAEMLRQLDWIQGVRVQVRVLNPLGTEAAIPRINPSAGHSHEVAAAAGDRATDNSPSPRGAGFTPVIGINRPVTLEPDALVPGSIANSAPGTASSERPTEPERGKVLVNVPRSYYFNAIINKDDHRQPSKEELEQMVQRTEKRIRTHVDLVVAGSGSWDVSVDTITDDIPLPRPAVLTAADQRRRIVEMGVIAAVAALISVLVVVGSRIQTARRPVRLSEPALTNRRYHADTASVPGPSERVREWIRRDPEAAASVLRRWTGQGQGGRIG